VMEQLRQARQIVRYFMMAYYALIGITVVFIAIIFLINMNVKDFARAVGAVLFIYGIAVFAGVIFARNFDFLTLMSGIPHELQLWLAALVSDALSPLQWFSLGVLILGLILIIISIVVRSKEKEAVA
ncbi:MAG: hypothetical protein N2506_04690, partial [Dehalococcoidales bacterium]|nr:hypothetical protein [Dehalococcoidales bacterium]